MAFAGAAAEQKAAGGALGVSKSLTRTAVQQTLPFTGLPLWVLALTGVALMAIG